jgi:hypothetical protein
MQPGDCAVSGLALRNPWKRGRFRAQAIARQRQVADLLPAARRATDIATLGAVPTNHGTHLLRRRLAYELQAKALGDLPREAQRRLKRLRKAFKAEPGFTPLPGLGLKPGTVLTRTWHGVLHQVQVTNEGFDYRSKRFDSLSEVARRITGTRWSGPLFFGLKGRAEPSS